ncbi:MAG: hypothetical protein HRF40_07395 [Nitrososphaera sp.]|jgi:hypothetical protein
MFSDADRYRYRVDGTVSYTFDAKFARVLKKFAKDAKVILLIRNQKQRLASMYFFSFIAHNQEDFLKWLEHYFTPYLETYLYYDKVVAYYENFAEESKIIQTPDLISPQVHKQLFEFLNIRPINVDIKYKNLALLTPSDSKAKRDLILGLGSIKVGALRIAKSLGLENEFHKMARKMGERLRDLLAESRRNDYSEILNLVPTNIASKLEDDYASTIDFAQSKGMLISS